MKLALDDLHQNKLRDGKQHVERLLRQWQQTIQQIKEQEQRVGCHLLPKDVAFETAVEMAQRLPDANYLQVVEIRERGTHELSATVHHAQASLQQEIISASSAAGYLAHYWLHVSSPKWHDRRLLRNLTRQAVDSRKSLTLVFRNYRQRQMRVRTASRSLAMLLPLYEAL